jgi:tellurite resistance protein TerC
MTSANMPVGGSLVMLGGGGPHLLWGGFIAFLIGCLAVDIFFHRRPRQTGVMRDALRWTGIWIGLAAACAIGVGLTSGAQALLQFVAAYSVEWSLSADNVLVFAAVLAGLAVPVHLRYHVLFFGSLGAIVLRLGFVLAGAALLGHFGWLTYFFGAFLLVAAVRFIREPAAGPARPTSLLSRLRMPPIVLAALAIAVTDLAFATDSIPAVFGMTRDPLVAFASNAMAVAGLRSIYFVLQAAILRVRYLAPALVTLLAFVGTKMLVPRDIPAGVSLGVIAAILGTATLASWLLPRRRAAGTSVPVRSRRTSEPARR